MCLLAFVKNRRYFNVILKLCKLHHVIMQFFSSSLLKFVYIFEMTYFALNCL